MNIENWLQKLGLTQYLDTFRKNEIDVDILAELTEDDLRELSIPLGDRKRILKATKALSNNSDVPEPATEGQLSNISESPEIQAERRPLSIMFVDLVGSTALANGIDPEDMRDIIRGFQKLVSEEIYNCGGYIGKFMGDGMLAYFGFPKASEHDAVNSVTAGLAIARRIARLAAPDGKPLSVRVGIATGLVIVGELVGNEEARERDVIGHTPNFAARLQSIANPGSVVIAADTKALIGNQFDLNPLDAPPLKGITGPVEAYEVVGERLYQNDSNFSNGAFQTRMIGREQELSLLINKWQLAKDSECQVLLLTGEAGIGKSKLLSALLETLNNEKFILIKLQCSPSHTESAFYPIINHISQSAKIVSEDSPEERFTKLATFCEKEFPMDSQATELIGSILGIGTDAKSENVENSAQQRRSKTLELFANQILGNSQEIAQLLILEDIHWIDPTTLEYLEHIFAGVTGNKLLAVLTSRPKSLPILPNYPYFTSLSLNRLGTNHTASIIANLTNGKSMPAPLLNDIISKTDGVPLFVEELTKTILASDILVEEDNKFQLAQPMNSLSIPSTLHGSLMARLDKLPAAKSIAQTAACVGRIFDRQILNDTCLETAEQLDDALGELVSADIINAHGVVSENVYKFKHALVCDTAYESLLKSRRIEIHNRILEVLLAQDAPPEALAHHYVRAGQPAAAAACLLKAGQNSLKISASKEAIAYLKRGIEFVETLENSVDSGMLKFRLYAFLGTSYMLSSGWGAPEIEEFYTKALAHSDATVDAQEKIWILWGIWVYHQGRGRIDTSIGHGNRILKIANDSCESTAILVAQIVKMQEAFYQGRCEDNLFHGLQIENIYSADEHDFLKDAYSLDLKLCWHVHAMQTYWIMGDIDRARTELDTANARAASLDHVHSKIWATVWGANLHLMANEVDIIFETVPLAIETAKKNGFDYVSNLGELIVAAASIVKTHSNENLQILDKAIEKFCATGAFITIPYFRTFRAQSLHASGKSTEALDEIGNILQTIEDYGERWCKPFVLKVKGDILTSPAIAQFEAGESAYNLAIKIAKEHQTGFWCLKAELALAHHLIISGKIKIAKKVVEQIDADTNLLMATIGVIDKNEIINKLEKVTGNLSEI